MPLVTGKITWRNSTANKTYSALLTALKNFIVNSGNYTLVADQISASSYFVVKSVRNTGFTGDSITAQISISNAGGNFLHPFLAIQAWESWSGVTGTNYGTVRPGYGNSLVSHFTEDHTQFSLSLDTDIWLSCDTTFILSMSRIYDSNINHCYSVPNGVVNFERLSGDSDTGTFYGHFGRNQFNNFYYIYTPKRWDNSTGDNSYFNISTKLGSRGGVSIAQGLNGPDEGGKHVAFDINVNFPSSGKIKGRILGAYGSTYGLDLRHGELLPSSTSPQYIAGKPVSIDSNLTILMQTASAISTITT